MISRLPPWVEAGGFLLTLLAGSVNAIGLLGFNHQAVSHLTGISSLLSLDLTNQNFSAALHLSLILLSFVLGSVLSGCLIERTALRLGRPYGVALLIESVFLVFAMIALLNGSDTGHYWASAACGLQNGMVTTFSGAVVRTTHVSGIFTDLGIMIGQRLRGKRWDRRRAILYVTLVGGFFVGGVIGSYGFRYLEFGALGIPATIALLLSLAYWIYDYQGKT